MKQIIALLFLTAVFASCKNTWSEEDKKAFYDSCTEDAKSSGTSLEKIKPYCDCVFGKIIAKYPNENDALEHMDSLARDPELLSCKIVRDK